MCSGELRHAARPGPRSRSRLALEIKIALCLQAVLLYLLWAAFFSHPASRQLNERRVAADLFGPAPTTATHTEAQHGSRP
jgi:hypothetical protein